MNAIGRTKTVAGNNILQQKYMERVLNQEAQSIIQDQDRVLGRFNPSQKDGIIASRRFQVTGNTLTFTHAMTQRFIDMKRIRGIKKSPVPIHNKILYTHFNSIINQMAFGFTQDIQQTIAQEYNIEL